MKTNKILIIILIVVLIAGIVFYFKSKKKGDTIGDIMNIFKGSLPDVSNKRQYIGDTSKSVTDKDWLRDSLGLGEVYLSSFSDKDAKIARLYIENYMRKGVKIMPNDPMYNDVVRIANYSQLFSKP